MVAGDHNFHPECFCCKLCNAFIGDGDSYALVERSKLYWYELLNFIHKICVTKKKIYLVVNAIDDKCNRCPPI